jgi:hypothetical protein
MSEQTLRRQIAESGISAHAEVINEGGLWVVMKKQSRE